VQAITAGMLTNGLNPKTAVFVISLYTQIIGPGVRCSYQLGCGLFISLSHLVWFTGVAAFLSRPAIRARVLANQRIFNAAIGAVLVLLALRWPCSMLACPGWIRGQLHSARCRCCPRLAWTAQQETDFPAFCCAKVRMAPFAFMIWAARRTSTGKPPAGSRCACERPY
jgi:hypothetical protein